MAAGDDDPHCVELVDDATCGGTIKSATISFGQQLVASDLARAEAHAESCDLLVAVGTTLAVWPIAGIVPTAMRAGAPVVIVNRGPTAMDEAADVVVDDDIETALPAIVGGLSPR